jgi:large subunit ribosomal protein L21
LAKKLNQAGIVSYSQLAELSEEDIAHLEKNVIKSTGRFKRNDWVGQAKKLAQA